jgi:hypothetical protein
VCINFVEQERRRLKICCIGIEFRITEATKTYSEFVILLFSQRKLLQQCPSTLRYAYTLNVLEIARGNISSVVIILLEEDVNWTPGKTKTEMGG